jgi:hypothetical protein
VRILGTASIGVLLILSAAVRIIQADRNDGWRRSAQDRPSQAASQSAPATQSDKPSDADLERLQTELSEAATQLYGGSREIRFNGLKLKTRGSSTAALRDYKSSSARDVAEGVILIERGSELYLDIAPCKNEPLAFHDPYKKRVVGKVTCDGKQFDRVQVEQDEKKQVKKPIKKK